MKHTSDDAEKKDTVVNAKAAETVMVGDSELGDVKIHDGVIATLTRRAALAVEGVSRLAGNALVDNLAEIVGSRRMQARAITVSVEGDNCVAIELKINILVGFRLPDVCQQVQRAVIDRIESVTGMTVTRVNVAVQDIDEQPAEDDELNEGESEAAAAPVCNIPMP